MEPIELDELSDSELMQSFHSLNNIGPGIPLQDGEQLVIDGTSSGLSHIKMPISQDVDDASAYESAVAASLHLSEEEAHARMLEEAEVEQAYHLSEEEAHARILEEAALEQAIQRSEAGAYLDKQTPRDGHCLFHALLYGGLGRTQNQTGQPSIAQLRALAIGMASEEQLRIAAIGSGEIGLSAEEYR